MAAQRLSSPPAKLGRADNLAGRATCRPTIAKLDRRRHAVLRLRPEFPGPAVAGDPCEANPGHAARIRRPVGPDRRPLLRVLLLLHRHSGRLAGGQDQSGRSADTRVRDLERGDDGLRHGRELSAARAGAHDGRFRRSRRRSALLLDHFRLFPAGAPRNRARHLQSRAADRRGAGHRFRRFHRRRFQLALCLSGPRRGGAFRGDRDSAHRARTAARRSGSLSGTGQPQARRHPVSFERW